jgi:8-oxo-dGTP pyrophosphatase MutT (NUDIX family)
MKKSEMRRQAVIASRVFMPRRLHDAAPDLQTQNTVNKAGIVPFVRGSAGEIQFYLMSPRASEKYSTPSKLQICKGTREYKKPVKSRALWVNYGIKDMGNVAPENLETLLVTALREGIEEVGLRISNISQIFEQGLVEFKSETSGEPKKLWLYLAEVQEKAAFDLPDEEHANTGERRWVSLSADRELIREDYQEILQGIVQKLQEIGKNR